MKGLLFIDCCSAANACSTSLKIWYTLKEKGMQRKNVQILEIKAGWKIKIRNVSGSECLVLSIVASLSTFFFFFNGKIEWRKASSDNQSLNISMCKLRRTLWSYTCVKCILFPNIHFLSPQSMRKSK